MMSMASDPLSTQTAKVGLTLSEAFWSGDSDATVAALSEVDELLVKLRSIVDLIRDDGGSVKYFKHAKSISNYIDARPSPKLIEILDNISNLSKMTSKLAEQCRKKKCSRDMQERLELSLAKIGAMLSVIRV